MKKQALTILLCLLLVPACPAGAAKVKYTLPVKGSTVLQSTPDRAITLPQTAARHDAIPGESPVTGLPWAGQYLPMLVQISNGYGEARVKGKTVKAAGIGKRAPWGLQYADVLYEEILSGACDTRFAALYSDCFALGQPQGGVGPVRSARIGALLLRAQWQAALVYGGGAATAFAPSDKLAAHVIAQTGATQQGALIHTLSEPYRDMCYRVQGKKAPDNLSADILRMRGTVPATFAPQARPFLFASSPITGAGYEAAHTIHLDWGNTKTISHFVYAPGGNVYLRYCGAGTNPAKWAPFTSYASAQDTGDTNSLPLAFANVIIQRVSYVYKDGSAAKPILQSVGQGNADLFISGRYIPGYWRCASLGEPTMFYDDQGSEVQLQRGKTFIAQFPVDALCAYTAQE